MQYHELVYTGSDSRRYRAGLLSGGLLSGGFHRKHYFAYRYIGTDTGFVSGTAYERYM